MRRGDARAAERFLGAAVSSCPNVQPHSSAIVIKYKPVKETKQPLSIYSSLAASSRLYSTERSLLNNQWDFDIMPQDLASKQPQPSSHAVDPMSMTKV